VSLVKEMGKVLDSSREAVLCAMSHGQASVDGYRVKPTDDRRWTRAQLRGRLARINYREGRLFGTSRRADDTTQIRV
jgi:hypothetical protein